MKTGTMWQNVMTAYWFAAFMAMMAIVPGCNFLYSGHGGPAWFLLPLAFPIALLRLTWLFIKTKRSEKKRMAQIILSSLALYALVSACAAYLGTWSINRTFGLEVPPLVFWGDFFFPFYISPFWRS